MPAHNIRFNETNTFEVQPPVVVDGATRVCLLGGYGSQLRRMDNNEDKFVPGGTYRDSWITLPNWKAAGIQRLYGFLAKKRLSGYSKSDLYGGSLSYQLSNNNGANWFYHDGASWTAASISDWNTETDVDFNLPDFPMTVNKEIRVRAKLATSTNGNATPFLEQVTIFADLDYNFQDDLLRSMKEWLERYVWIRAKYYVQMPQPTGGGIGCPPGYGPSDVITLDDKKWEEMSAPVTVYNLTTDPNKTTNLFAGFVAGGIQLTSEQEGVLEASFMARPPVYIGAEEFIQLASIPSIVIQLGNVKERRDLRRGNEELDWAFARRRAQWHVSRVWFDAEFRISCQSDLKREAVIMCDAVNKALTHRRFVLSQQTGETMPVPYTTPMTPAHRVAQGLFVRDYACTLFGKAWLRPEETVERRLSEEIVVLVHPYTPGKFEYPYVETMEVTS